MHCRRCSCCARPPPVASALMAMVGRVRAAAAALFFRYFFVLLVLAASASQWAVLAWVMVVGFGMTVPGWAHAAGVALLYTANRALTASPRRRGPVFRWYSAGALTALFCALFLLASAI